MSNLLHCQHISHAWRSCGEGDAFMISFASPSKGLFLPNWRSRVIKKGRRTSSVSILILLIIASSSSSVIKGPLAVQWLTTWILRYNQEHCHIKRILEMEGHRKTMVPSSKKKKKKKNLLSQSGWAPLNWALGTKPAPFLFCQILHRPARSI